MKDSQSNQAFTLTSYTALIENRILHITKVKGNENKLHFLGKHLYSHYVAYSEFIITMKKKLTKHCVCQR